MGILKKVMPIATILAVLMSMLTPATPAHAWEPLTWNTQAAFNAGVRTNVDTSSSPNNVLLSSSLNTGDGSDGTLTVNDFYLIDHVRSPVMSSSSIGSIYLVVGPNPAAVGFIAGQEVLIIQMKDYDQ